MKAKYYGNRFKIPTIADDSGLSVDCLNGFPGLNSKRWLNDQSYEVKNKKLIGMVNDKKSNRKAKYICALAFFDSEINFSRVFFGEWRGHIARSCTGTYGFGYDPIFIDDEYKKSAAKLDPKIKNERSHRGIATLGFMSWASFFS